jgi:hypothetical protein
MWGIVVWSEVGVLIHPTGVLWYSGEDSGLASPFLEHYCPRTIPSQTLVYAGSIVMLIQSSPPNRSCTIDSTQWFKMSLYPSAFVFPCSISRGPSPFHEKHPHTVMPPPPNLTVGITHAVRYCSIGIRHTQTLPLDRHMV